MFEVTEASAAEYLRSRGLVAANESISVRRLTGGVSNEVLLVERPALTSNVTGTDSDTDGQIVGNLLLKGSFVLKQARAQLRTPQPWFSSVERNWREVAVQQRCAALAPGNVPAVLFVDRENFLYVMDALPPGHQVWRDELLAGRIDPALGGASGRLLAALHSDTWSNIESDEALGLADRTLFHELRVAPYYEAVARDVPEARGWMRDLIVSLGAPPRALVHADFSPKNLLLWDGQLTLVDFETGHFGDPAFDLGFFLAHLVLKTIYHASRADVGASRGLTSPAAQMLTLIQQFWDTYLPVLVERIGGHPTRELTYRGLQHLAGCLWARLDGTSRVDYLDDLRARSAVRGVCREIFRKGPTQWSDVEWWVKNASPRHRD